MGEDKERQVEGRERENVEKLKYEETVRSINNWGFLKQMSPLL